MSNSNALAPASSIASKGTDFQDEKTAYDPNLNRIIEADELASGDDAGELMKGQRLDFTEEEGELHCLCLL